MIKDIFSYPMRIFFLTSAICAIFAGAIFFTPVDFVSFHKFAFLHLTTALAYAGFLLTGLTDWTNFSQNLKIHSLSLFAIFVLSFLCSFLNLTFAHGFILLFWLYLSALCVYMIWLDKNADQFGVLGFLLLILAFEIAFLITGDEKFLNLQIHIHVIAILLVSFRVSVVLGKEALAREFELENALFVPNLVYKNIAIVCIVAFLAISALKPDSFAIGYVGVACAVAILAKLKEWHYNELLRHDFVIFYYLLQLFVALAYLGYGLSNLLGLGFEANCLHIIAINGILFAIMLIFNIAGLRHSGQELEFCKLSKIAFILLLLAGISRAILANFGIGFYIHLPAVLVIVAFLFWLIDFYKIFRDNDFTDDPE
ncbi:MAG: NnrS family protein [Campylobacter sp.]